MHFLSMQGNCKSFNITGKKATNPKLLSNKWQCKVNTFQNNADDGPAKATRGWMNGDTTSKPSREVLHNDECGAWKMQALETKTSERVWGSWVVKGGVWERQNVESDQGSWVQSAVTSSVAQVLTHSCKDVSSPATQRTHTLKALRLVHLAFMGLPLTSGMCSTPHWPIPSPFLPYSVWQEPRLLHRESAVMHVAAKLKRFSLILNVVDQTQCLYFASFVLHWRCKAYVEVTKAHPPQSKHFLYKQMITWIKATTVFSNVISCTFNWNCCSTVHTGCIISTENHCQCNKTF